MFSTKIKKEISYRKTFAIISHPDAGKTTITDKLLSFNKVEAKRKKEKEKKTSDWMTLEQKRGISITSSIMQFKYKQFTIKPFNYLTSLLLIE